MDSTDCESDRANICCSLQLAIMATVAKCKRVVPAQIAHPFGDERSVNQAFPAGIPAEEAGNFAFYCNPFALTASLTPRFFLDQSKPKIVGEGLSYIV